MHRLHFTVVAFIAVLFCGVLEAAVSSSSLGGMYRFGETALLPGKSSAAPDDKPLEITLAVNDIYCADSSCICVRKVAARKYDDIQQALWKKHRIKLKLVYYEEVYELEKALGERKYDGAICKPWIALRLAPQYRLKYKRVADLLDPENGRWLTGVFMVKKDSPIRSMQEVTGKTVVMGEPSSYEKYIAARRYLHRQNIKPAKIYTKASCLECIGELLDGHADVAVVSDYTMSASCAVDIADPADFRILAHTEKIPLTSVVLDIDRVPVADALRLQKALIDVSGGDAPSSMLSRGFVMPVSWIPFEKQGK